MSDNKNEATHIPEELRTQIENFRKKLWRIKITEAVLAGLFGLIVSFIVIFAVERFIEIPAWLRFTNLILGFSIFAVFAPIWINRWVFKHRRENQIARLIACKFPHLGDRILGVIELDHQDVLKEHVSPELRQAAMRTVAAEAKKRDFNDALPDSWHGKWSIGVASAVGLTVVGFAFMPEPGINAIKRWLTPWEETERFTYVQFDTEQYKNGLIVPLNEDFDVTFKLKEESRREIKGSARYSSEPWEQRQFSGDSITFPFAGKTKKGEISVKAGDAEDKIKIIPTPRPIIKKTLASVEWPAYLGRKANKLVDMSGDTLQVLKGSKLSLISQSDRNLASASILDIYRLAHEGEEIEGEDETFLKSDLSIAANVVGKKITTGPILIDTDTIKFGLTWRDTYGLDAKRPSGFRLEPVADQAPAPYIEAKTLEYTQLLTEAIDFTISAEDDFGIKFCGYNWVGKNFQPSPTPPSKGEATIYFPSNDVAKELSFNSVVTFDPKTNGIKTPQTVTFTTWVEDQLPNRERVFSEQTVIVHFITKAMRTQEIENELEDAQMEIERIRESGNENREKTEDLKHLLNQAKKDAKSSDPDKAAKAKEKLKDLAGKIPELAQKEEQGEEDIKKVNDKIKKILQKAMQNKTLDKEALKKLDQMSKNLDKAAKAKKAAEKAMEKAQKAQDKQNENGEPKDPEEKQEPNKEMEEAIKKQKEADKALSDAAKQAKKAKEDSEQGTFVNRLKKIARDQMAITQLIVEKQLAQFDKDVDLSLLGNQFETLPDGQKNAIATAFKLQEKVKLDLGWIAEDLAEYEFRTKKEGLDKVLEAMESVKLNNPKNTTNSENGMDKLMDDLAYSRWGMAYSYAEEWSVIIDAWAKQLAAAGASPPPPGGGGGSPPPGGLNDDDFNFMLRVMEMVKKEQDIRGKTRAMEQQKRTLEYLNKNK